MIDGLKTELQRIVGIVETNLLADLQAVKDTITGINFQMADAQEVITTLAAWSNDPDLMFDKFPLVAVFLPGDGITRGEYEGIRLQVFIINSTQQNYSRAQREQYNFNPILLPIYHELVRQLARSRFFVCYQPVRDMRHTPRLLDCWGKDGILNSKAKVFNDYIDAVQMENLELIFSPINY